jgi:hypothetical protein
MKLCLHFEIKITANISHFSRIKKCCSVDDALLSLISLEIMSDTLEYIILIQNLKVRTY